MCIASHTLTNMHVFSALVCVLNAPTCPTQSQQTHVVELWLLSLFQALHLRHLIDLTKALE